jgi:hypothetical protein
MKKTKLTRIVLFALVFCFQQINAQNFIDKYLNDPLVYTTIGNSSDNINKPRDLDFKPNTNELWVVNNGNSSGGNVVVFYNAGQNNQSTQYKKDSHSGHFMPYPSALAFSNIGEWASSNELKSTALWSADTNVFARVFQNNWVTGYPLGSHLDMLHQSPFSMGIAHDTLKTYWVFDGWNSNICKYDFNVDHSPGYDDHSSGKIWRYTDVTVSRAVGIPSHMVLDKSSRWLYIVDAGNKKLIRINTSTGNIGGNLLAPNETLSLYKSVTGATQETIDTYTSQPTGIDYSNNRLIVSDYTTGDIRVYDTSIPTPTLMGIISTGQSGIMGVKIGTDGKIWFVNNTLNTVVRIDPLPVITDAAIVEITSPFVDNSRINYYSPAYNSCNGSISPGVILKNNGTTALTSAVINYKVDTGSNVTFNWTGNLSAGATVAVVLPNSSIPSGEHKITVNSSSPNGLTDLNPLNDAKDGYFRNKDQAMTLPFVEDFSNPSFPPSGWSYMGYNKYCNMSRSNSVGGYGLSSESLKMNNYSGAENITGQKDYFLSPRIDFSNASEITFLTFDLAYAQRNTSSTDQLDLSISNDCGATWTSVYNKSGNALSTTSPVGSAYTPAPQDWITEQIDLGQYQGEQEVMFLFTTNSNWGNNLYLDNINISTISTVGIKEDNHLESVKIYPNPSTGKLTIEGLGSENRYKDIVVTNIMGQQIMNVLQVNSNSLTLDLSDYVSGAYFISIKTETSSVVKKIIISKN